MDKHREMEKVGFEIPIYCSRKRNADASILYIRRGQQIVVLNKIEDSLNVDLTCDLCAPHNPDVKSFEELVRLVGEQLEPKRSNILGRQVFHLSI